MRRYRYRHQHLLGLLVLAVVVVGFASRGGGNSATPAAPTSSTASPQAAPASEKCHVTGQGEYVLPDPRCSPGAVDGRYTAAMVCRGHLPPRPPESVTEPQKRSDVARYGDYAGSSLHAYEEDHVVPLELAGDPTSMANRFPEYDAGMIPNPKDAVENAAHRAVCSGRMSLATAQAQIARNWIELGRQLGVGR